MTIRMSDIDYEQLEESHGEGVLIKSIPRNYPNDGATDYTFRLFGYGPLVWVSAGCRYFTFAQWRLHIERYKNHEGERWKVAPTRKIINALEKEAIAYLKRGAKEDRFGIPMKVTLKAIPKRKVRKAEKRG